MKLKNKTRVISISLSVLLIMTVFAVGCAPQQRNEADRYGTRFDLGANDRGLNDGATNWNDRAMDKYGTNLNPGDTARYGTYGNPQANRGLNGQGTADNTDNMNGNWGINGNSSRAQIENEVERIERVSDATVIVSGDTCYVGVDTDRGTVNNVAALRTEIANRIRNVDPSIKRVHVTTDENNLTQLRTYARDIDAGQPVRNFLNNLEDLFR